MSRFLLLPLLLLLALGANAQPALHQTLKGTVTDALSGSGIAGATVRLDDGTASALTDSAGGFRLGGVGIGRRRLRVSCVGYEDAQLTAIEVTASKEVVVEIRLCERVTTLDAVTIHAKTRKNRALNEAAVVSARQFSVDEAVRYAGTRNDPSRMAQSFAGVSGANDARNDIIIRGNSPSGVRWRLEGVDIPNPNHYSTLGATGGPVTILNTNTLKNSDFLTSAFPATYGNALAGVFDLRLRNGNNERFEFLGQMGFNGFEAGAEGPLGRSGGASFLVNYRYSLVAAVQKLGLNVGTGTATPYYQDLNFKVNLPTKKAGTFSLFGFGGESHIRFDALDEDNLYATPDGSLRERTFRSRTGFAGIAHQYFYNPRTSGRFVLALAGFDAGYRELFYGVKPDSIAFDKKNTQVTATASYTFTHKFSARNGLTAGAAADRYRLTLENDYLPQYATGLVRLYDVHSSTYLLRAYANWYHRFTDRLSTNLGLYSQRFTLNGSGALEPRWNLKYQLRSNQSLSVGAGLHSQTQPLEVYFYETQLAGGTRVRTDKDLDFTRSLHGVLGYDVNLSAHLRLKAEVYGQYIYDAPVERSASSFSLLNSGADFYFPDKTNLVNRGKGANYGVELTLERFLDKGFYYLLTGSLFNSRYEGSDGLWRNTAFNSCFVSNLLGGKEFRLNEKRSFGLDTKITFAGGQRYTPFDLAASAASHYVVWQEAQAYALRNDPYFRLDFKLSYTANGRHLTQKWYIDLQNLTGRKNLYVRTLNPNNGQVTEINQIGFFPNVNYQLTF